MMLFSDWDLPEQCPVRALLLLLYLTKWTSGNIFPGKQELERALADPHWDGHYKTHLEYDLFLRDLKGALTHVARKDGKWGSQTLRKTYYLLAIWGGAVGTFPIVMQGARNFQHKKGAKFVKNFCDSMDPATMLEYSALVSKWKPVFVADPTLIKSLNRYVEHSLPDIVQKFATNHVRPLLPQGLDDTPGRMIAASLKFNPRSVKGNLGKETARIDLYGFMDTQGLDDVTLAQLKHKIELCAVHAKPARSCPQPCPLHTQLANDAALAQEPKKKMRGKGGFDRLEERREAMSIKDQSQRLTRLLEILVDPANPQDFKSQTVTEGWRAWYTNMKRVKSCIDGCFGGNRDDFLRRYAPQGKVLKLSKWTCCCQPS
ncbi:MAG: hypothetical protein SGCHY_004116 [Lobulomycetales sp.]